jgi:predicted DNA-binding antitoxin AbrB/MazE fold protein
MQVSFEAIFEDGVFKPVVPLSIPDHARVQLTIIEQGTHSSYLHRSLPDFSQSTDDEFWSDLQTAQIDGPTLPADFTRADIYLDHE